MATIHLMFLMKSNFTPKSLVFSLVMVSVLVLGGCSSNNDQAAVRDYNNSIVQIQKQMLQKAEDSSKIFEEKELDPVKATSQMEGILAEVNKSRDQFKAIKMPKGAEDLADGMDHFFVVEVDGLNDVIASLKNLKDSSTQTDVDIFMNNLDAFSKKENDALDIFYQSQQKVASRYGQKIDTSEN